MKILNTIYSLLFLVFSLVLLSNCKKQVDHPVVITGDVSEIKAWSATVAGEIISDGGSAIIARGICWSNTNPPTIINNKTSDGTGIGSFTGHATELSPKSTYFFRAYATNSAETTYGESKVVTTPSILSLSAYLKETGTNYVEFGVEVTSDGGLPVTARGICWSSTNSMPTISDNKTIDGAGLGSFTTRISNLDLYTTYYFRAYATNGDLTAYAYSYFYIMRFAPKVDTENVLPVTSTTALGIGHIEDNGVGPITSKGICWSTSSQPTIADNKNEECIPYGNNVFYQCAVNGLTPNTVYYLRAFATNIAGTSYGNEYSFVLEQFGGPTVSDIDGNLYHTVTIGTQIWMVENLKTTSYRNGEPIPNVTDNDKWYNLSSGAYCNYLNDPQNPDYYGKLYNWYAVNDSRKIAPAGWHVPDETEFTKLINYLKNNGYGDVGKSMASKSAWNYYWNAVNTELAKNNSSGFTAFPAGTRGIHSTDYPPINSASFNSNGLSGTWWTISESNGNVRFLSLNLFTSPMPGDPLSIPVGPNVGSSKFRMDGFSVRCIKD